jgi:hypothetical protein
VGIIQRNRWLSCVGLTVKVSLSEACVASSSQDVRFIFAFTNSKISYQLGIVLFGMHDAPRLAFVSFNGLVCALSGTVRMRDEWGPRYRP